MTFLRGINVGGNNLLPMKELTAILEKNGCASVRTYIQSGNVTLKSPAASASSLATLVTSAVKKRYGFAPRVLVLTRSELEKAAKDNPFPVADDQPQLVHLLFLSERPTNPDMKGLQAAKTKTESFVLKGRVLYMHTPDGMGRSKLARDAERLLGVEATARNWRTVKTLIEMASEE